ncbi:MAG: hypothetical protein RIT14_367 [Pseudomonadota bacterium]|jgi:hypothetical protein
MTIVENTQSRLILHERAVLAEIMILVIMAVFALMAWVSFARDEVLGLAFILCVVVTGLLFLFFAARTTVTFDRLGKSVTIRQKSLLTDRSRALDLTDVVGATLIGKAGEGMAGSSTVALIMRPGYSRHTIPLCGTPISGPRPRIARDQIEVWLKLAEPGSARL